MISLKSVGCFRRGPVRLGNRIYRIWVAGAVNAI